MAAITSLHPHPTDATLTVTRAAHVLGVHPNTVRSWSDAGRLRYYRINPRGDRRYRTSDLLRFLAGAVEEPSADATSTRGGRRRSGRGPVDAPTRPFGPAGTPTRRAATPTRRAAARADQASSSEPDGGTSAALAVLTGLGHLAASIAGNPTDPESLLGSATRTIREGAGLQHASVWRLTDGRLDPVGVSGSADVRLSTIQSGKGIFGRALAEPGRTAESSGPDNELGLAVGLSGCRLACAIPGPSAPWGALLAVTDACETGPAAAMQKLIGQAASMVGSILRATETAAALDRRIHWAEALGRVATDIGSRLDPDQLLVRLVDHAIAMFDGDRAAVFLVQPDGTRRSVASRNLSTAYLTARARADRGSLTAMAIAAHQPQFAVGFRDDPRAAATRALIVQEGYDTVCIAPLYDGATAEVIGSLNVYHDRPHQWTDDELRALAALAGHAGAAILSAGTHAQLATWAAQLQSIQQFGARLNRLSDVAEIGAAIATELRELIDYHNVRVYRQFGDDLIPVALRGQIGEYGGETPDQLRIKVGSGITGWVAAHRVAEILPDAAADPRANLIPGTDGEIEESMLLAPMVFEDEVLGVLVLSKLGLNQFTDDDLRLLVIYASFAAQAMAHADATQRLQRQLKSRRDLLQITETILGTLDTASVLESVADRLGELVGSDNVWIELLDDDGKNLIPVIAKGVSAKACPEPFPSGESGIATWVAEHNEAALLPDQFHDSRVNVGEGEPVHGGLICVPLRGRAGAIGVLTIERLGEGRSFTEDEFELVQLFAAQVSIAVQNARAHGVITRQAETDDLTGLLNHRSFRHKLEHAVGAGDPFSLLMLDLDRFKLVNDTFGHEAGNKFLQCIATAIVTASRDTDAVFRYGGDEFVVLLPRTDAEHVGPVADRIRRAFAKVAGPTSEMRRKGIHVDASAGVATYPTDGTTPEGILLAADRACFMVKRDGGGRVATAAEGLALAGEFTLQIPTPIDTGS